MVTTVQIEFDDDHLDQYERLKEVKDRHGMTWKGMLLHAERELEGEDDAED